MSHHYGEPLSVRVVDGELRISIGVDVLAHAVSYSDWANPWDDEQQDNIRTFAIADAPQFAKDVVSAMQREEEDGSSPLSDFLDAMSEAAVNDGSLGLHDEDVAIEHGKTHAVETWASDGESKG